MNCADTAKSVQRAERKAALRAFVDELPCVVKRRELQRSEKERAQRSETKRPQPPPVCSRPACLDRLRKGRVDPALARHNVEVQKALKVREAWKREKRECVVRCLIYRRPMPDWVKYCPTDDPVCDSCERSDIREPVGWAGYGGGHGDDDPSGGSASWDKAVRLCEDAR